MNKILTILVFTLTLMTTPSTVLAQGMMGNWGNLPSATTLDDHTAQEEAEGKEIWEKFQAKQLKCKNLTNDNFAVLGEYFMGQTIGDTQRHASMNQMMSNMMGEEGEEQMHVVMGKRLSGCEPDAQGLSNGTGFMPMMMNMMTGSAFAPWIFGGTKGGGNPMMGYGNFGGMMGGFGILATILWIVLLIDLILLGVWLWKQIQKK